MHETLNSSKEPKIPRWDTCAISFALVFPSLVTLFYFVLADDLAPLVQQTSYAIGKTIQFAFPVLWVLGYQRRPLRFERPRATGLGLGLGFGLLVLVAMLLLYHAYLKPAGYFLGPGEAIRQKVTGFGVSSLPRYMMLAAFYALAHSFLEEYYWRWFVFGQLCRWLTMPAAVLISSLGFMAHHVIVLSKYFGWSSPATAVFSLAVAGGGAIWAWLYHWSKSLYVPWLSHLIVDAAIFIIGYDLVRQMLR